MLSVSALWPVDVVFAQEMRGLVSLLRAVIVDDDASWREQAVDLLLSYARQEGLELYLNAYASPQELFEAQSGAPDVLFSDIELSQGESGIDLVRHAAELWPRCQVVYMTNHLRYAPEVYVTDHLWFVLKESFADRLPEIMDKLQGLMEEDASLMVVRTTDRVIRSLPCRSVTHLERTSRVTRVSTADGSVYLVPDRLTALLADAPAGLFARTHGSYAVNLAHVSAIKADAVCLDTGAEVPLSRRFARTLRESYLLWADRHTA